MTKQAIRNGSAPRPVAAYAQDVRLGTLLQVAGQGPADPGTGAYVEGGVVEQTRRTMRNVEAILGAAGTSFDDVMMVRVYLARVADFPGLNTAYSEFVSERYPARTTVYVGPPEGMLVEVDVLAVPDRPSSDAQLEG